jgi:hypothetical protein
MKKLGALDCSDMAGGGRTTGLDWTGLDWTGLDWTGLDWTGLDWTGLDWTGLAAALMNENNVNDDLTCAS